MVESVLKQKVLRGIVLIEGATEWEPDGLVTAHDVANLDIPGHLRISRIN